MSPAPALPTATPQAHFPPRGTAARKAATKGSEEMAYSTCDCSRRIGASTSVVALSAASAAANSPLKDHFERVYAESVQLHQAVPQQPPLGSGQPFIRGSP